MQLSHSRPVSSAVFDDPNLVSCAGLVPMAALAQKCGLAELADAHLSVPTDKGANAGAKVSCLVAGMVAGADSIDDMALLRHGAMGTVFDRPYAPSTLGSFLREFAFGHVRQLDAVGSRLLGRLAKNTPLMDGIDGPVLVDLDDTIIEVHGYAKQGSGYGYSGVRGLKRAAGHRQHWHGGAGDRRPAAPERLLRLTARCEAAGRRRARYPAAAAGADAGRDRGAADVAAGGLGVLRLGRRRRR